jgi:hypothetical protein
MASSVTNILEDIQLALTMLEMLPGVGADAALVSALVALLQKSLIAYKAAAGKPFDVTLIPIEPLVS